ncbi:triose-phosphate isomerase [Blattabacterium cuenoti]|uniref:triose-phosphate isomerase n=1 Tax=Blattabacterium cuenoti TaxID=1653831 RepID=UPI00163BEFC1|nr:triose-phosphate isomerase [Blattabacterium cuenoti]
MKEKIIIANWKMNYDFNDTISFIRNLLKINLDKKINHKKKIIIAPSFPFLHISNKIVKGSNINIAAQNFHHMDKGAYTGEVSAHMLESIGINKIILGHSERRIIFSETEEILLSKIKIALKHKFYIIFCVGETYDERSNNKHFIVIKKQLSKTIFKFTTNEIKFLCIAYEPVWAIGTGITATPKEVQSMHYFIRFLFLEKYGKHVSDKLQILYGGSINDINAKNFFSQEDVDGGLIGNSSLEFSKFLNILLS